MNHARLPVSLLSLAIVSALSATGLRAAETGAPSLQAASTDQAEAKRREAVPTIEVIGQAGNLDRIGGAATVVDDQLIQEARAFNVNDVLRLVPGVFPREEEGFGLRPNIGIRGLNPTRSTKVLLLEDGLPLAYSPYGDNASYYHPAIERFSSLEVLKGAAQIAFGPHTVGGVVNYLTPNPPADFAGKLRLAAGTDGYQQQYLELGDSFGAAGRETGVLFQAVRKQAEGAREHMQFDITDFNLKLVQQLGDQQAITFKASRYDEDSDVPYSGLTLAEFRANPRYNPFTNDNFTTHREGMSLVHHWSPVAGVELDTAIYKTEFHRDWWRQSSNSGQRPSDSSDPLCGGMANLHTTCGTEGRLRDYDVTGVEPRLTITHAFGTLKAGVRYQEEQQQRLQINADTPRGRTPGTTVNGGLKENNLRDTEARAWFVENTFVFGDWTLTPGVRHEDIEYARRNRMNNATGSTSVSETLAGLGGTWQLSNKTVLFAGVHEGFSPPRVEDIINNNNGQSIELDAEKSLNSEIGVRHGNGDGIKVEAAWFRLDFDNQIVPASVAGGAGATLTSAGETLHQGLEVLLGYDRDASFKRGTVNPFARMAWTWVSDAEYTGTRFSSITPNVSVRGNRLPYAPEHTLSLIGGIETVGGFHAQLEVVFVDQMYTDDLNTRAISANGQRGLIGDYTVYNLSANYRFPDTDITLFVSGRNLTDELYVVDMSRGLIPGMARSWQAGVEWQF